MPRCCASVGCKEKDEKDNTYSFHRFPKNIVTRKAWLIKMNRRDPVEKKRLWKPKAHDRLCSKLFEDTCFTQSTLVKKSLGWKCKPQLKDDAVPTIFPHLKEKQLKPQCGLLTKRRKIEVTNLHYFEGPEDSHSIEVVEEYEEVDQERIEYAEVIERLGGTILEKQQFDPACTHVVIGKPSRNEKFLAAVATGRWVLHKSYLMACRQEGRFVTEEEHEWGNPAMSHLMQNLDSQTYSLVQAAYKWRQKVQQMKKKDPNCNGAFQGWCVILLTEPKREDNFRRLLSAGGAKVLNVKPPFGVIEATHAFVELHKVRLSETDLEALVHGVSYILRTEYIAAHLTDPSPVPQNYIPPDIQKLQVRLQGEQARKRKPLQTDNDSSSSKRSRR